jgi:DNA-binding transcriptional MerR regulator/DNA-directed RNA polymerase subunit L
MIAEATRFKSGTEEEPVLLPINAVERETGVSKELLRMWERRYGFPAPQRDTQGDRIYPMEQVAKLRLLRRLIDNGFRPGKIMTNEIPELERLLRAQSKVGQEIPKDLEIELLQALRSRDHQQLRDYLSHQLIKMGLQSFILDFLQHANTIVGDAWVRGQLEVHEEHLFTEQVQGLVRQAIGNLREPTQAPRILLTTPPEETHTLGILMVEALLRLDNVDAVCYGAQMPVRDIAHAVSRHKMNIVAVSFSASYPASNAVNFLEELRFKLPLAVDIWGGGAALRSTRRSIEAVSFLHDLSAMRQAVLGWRRVHGVD